MNDNYPDWICAECGERLKTRSPFLASTFHEGNPHDPNDKCGWCGSKNALTEPRDFGYPRFEEEQ